MSDPGFYPAILPGSNAIGSFQIGVSPIGTVGWRWQDTILAQYANSPRLLQLIQNFSQYVDQTANMDNFFDLIWNIDTAVGYGLDVWGRIIGVSRTLKVGTAQYFGFEEALPGSQPWNQGTWYAGSPVTQNFNLTDDAYRTLLFAKALFNICDGSIPAINQLLLNLFPGRGNCYVQEGAGTEDTYFGFVEGGLVNYRGWNQAPFYSGEELTSMTMEYVFDFALTPVEQAIISQSDVLPTPCGVTAEIVINA